MPDPPTADAVTDATEHWFLKRGLPHFIAGYNASEDVWTRALPALALLFAAEVIVLAPSRDYSFARDLAAIAVSFAVLLGVWILANIVRGQRPLDRPDRVGPLELAAFLVLPALIPLVFGRQVRASVLTFIVNALIVTLIYVATSYAVVPMARWALGRLRYQLEAIVSLLTRALPLIALLVTFLFLTTEVWQTAGTLDGVPYWIAVLLFPLVGTLFLVSRLPRDLGELNDFVGWDEVVPLVAGTPVADAASEVPADAAVPPLGRREWGNVGLVSLFSQGIQILLVSVLIGAFFVLLGVLLVDATTTSTWIAPVKVNVLATFTMGDRQLVVTEPLLRVAGFLMAFSGLNFTVYLLTDETYRREFRSEVLDEVRQAFAVRAVYRARVVAAEDSAASARP